MPMRVEKIGLSLRVNADPQRPEAEQDYLVTNIDKNTENEKDVVKKLMNDADWATTFYVPNTEGATPLQFEVFAVKSAVINVEFLGTTKAKATVVYRPQLIPSAPSAGGKDPNQAMNDGEQAGDEPLGPEFSFDTQGGTRHITQSEETRHKKCYDSTGGVIDAPDLQGVIGLSGDGVDGCDIVAADHKWSITLKQCKLTQEYIRNAVRLTGTINSNTYSANGRFNKFFLNEKGECLFLGMTGNYTRADGWVLSWFFQTRENEISHGEGSSNGVVLVRAGSRPPITIPEKYGHDYIWHHYERSSISSFSVMIPSSAYVERVYKYDKEKRKLKYVAAPVAAFVDDGPLTLDYLMSAI